MDIDQFISGISFPKGECSLASPGFTAYYRGLLKPLGQLSEEEFAISSILNFSAQQLSNRTARNPIDHCIAHFTGAPYPFFSAMILKLVGYSEVHFLPTIACDSQVLERIHANLALNDSSEVRDPFLHEDSDISSISGHFGLIHMIDTLDVPEMSTIAERIAPLSDIIIVSKSLVQCTESLTAVGYCLLIQRPIGNRQVAVYRRTQLPGPRTPLEV